MSKELTVQATPSNLLAQAIDKGVSIDQLKELMELQDKWERKEAKKAFFDALSKFQATVPKIKKNKTASIPGKDGKPGYSYKHSDLENIVSSIRNSMQKNGLSHRWEFKDENNLIKCTCIISHRDGHSETTTMEGGKDNSGEKNLIQQTGSTQTYLQRYTLIGALGLSTADEDKDGKTPVVPAKKKMPTDIDEEARLQWKEAIDGVKSRIELNSLYVKNQKTVDSEPKLQEMFKERQNQLKKSSPSKVEMP